MRHLLVVFLAALCVSQVQAQWAGELVQIEEPQAEDIYAAGRDVEIVADVDQDVTAAAGQWVSISGRVGGDAEIAGKEIKVEAGAVVQGDLVWRSETEPQISSEAHIAGQAFYRAHH